MALLTLTWNPRSSRIEHDTSTWRVWRTDDRAYSVVRIISKVGMPERYAAARGQPPYRPDALLGMDFRSAGAARRACLKDARVKARLAKEAAKAAAKEARAPRRKPGKTRPPGRPEAGPLQ